MDIPSSAKPTSRPRELKIKLPSLSYRRLVKPFPPDANNIGNDVDPIATPLLTPKLSVRDRGVAVRRPCAERSSNAELIGSRDEEQRSGRRSSIGSVSIDRRLVTSERNYVIPESQEQEEVQHSGDVKHSVRRRISMGSSVQDNRDGQDQIPSPGNSLGQSGGLLSNHAVLTIETLRTRSIPRSCMSSEKKNMTLQAATQRSGGGPIRTAVQVQSPCRALSFEDEGLTQDERNAQRKRVSSSLYQSIIVRKATKPSSCRGRRGRKEISVRQTPEPTKETPRTLQLGNQVLAQCECQPPRTGSPRDPGEDDGVPERQVHPSPNAPITCAPVNAIIVDAVTQNKNTGSSSAKHCDRAQVLRRARSPQRMRVPEETEFSSEHIEESPPRIAGDSEQEELLSSPRFTDALDDMNEEVTSSPRAEDGELQSIPHVDRVCAAQTTCSAMPESSPLCGERNDGSLTEPPSPEVVSTEPENDVRSVSTTVLCRSLLVTIPAGALRSPETPESSLD